MSWPASRKSRQDNAVFEASYPGPFSKRCDAPVVGNQAVVPLVVGLLNARCPAAIIWTIVAIVIFAVNLVLWRWSFAHVSKKIRKRLTPTLAHFNAATSVIFVLAIAFVVTAIQHIGPQVEFRGRSLAVLEVSSCARFASQASTTFLRTTGQPASNSFCLLSAIALAQPVPVAICFSCQREHCQPAKALPSKRDSCGAVSGGELLFVQAPTTVGAAAGEAVCLCCLGVAAVAIAKPVSLTVDSACFADNHEFSEPLADKICKLTWHSNPPNKGCCAAVWLLQQPAAFLLYQTVI